MNKQAVRALQKVYDWARDGERPGGEFDWFAIDESGHIAAFCTAGFGAVPDAVFEAPWTAFRDFVTYLEEASLASDSGYALYEDHNLFVYDYGDWTKGVYSRVVVPDNPVTFDQFPANLRAAIQAVRFSGKFEHTATVCAEDYWPCR